MQADAPERSARRALDPQALALVLQRLSAQAEAPWLHGEVAQRMAARLPVILLKPKRLIDWGAQLGASQDVLAQAYPGAQRWVFEVDPARRVAAANTPGLPWWSMQRWAGKTPRVWDDSAASETPVDLVWSNMGLHGAIDPQAVMAQWHRALRVDGFLMFSTLGPGSLQGLRNLYASQNWPPPHAPFVDMHDLGDMLVQAGFADPVMDQEQITLTWPDAGALLAELRLLGGNVDPRRAAGLRTPRWRARLCKLIENQLANADGRISLNFELVYGHAVRPLPRPRLAAQTSVPLEDLRAMARAGRPQP
jgi:malonyl-CoA O-methyltransferase